MKHFVLSCLLIVATTGTASPQWREGGKEIPDTPSSKHKGEFGVMLLLSSDPEAFVRSWNKSNSPEYKPKLETASSVTRGERLVGFLIFSGCKPGKEGKCDVTVDFLLSKPDGSTYAEYKAEELWSGKPPPSGILQLSVANLALKVEVDDPLGEYRMAASVHDKVGGVTLDLESRFKVVEGPPSAR